MNDEFEIPVVFQGKELSFPAVLLNYGYSYKIEMELQGRKVLFEPDESREWRALLPYGEAEGPNRINPELLAAIVASIEKILH